MYFADAAEHVLRENGGPLSVADITRRALDQGLINPRSDHSVTYVRAAIRKDSRRRESRNEPARFKQVSPGIYTLS